MTGENEASKGIPWAFDGMRSAVTLCFALSYMANSFVGSSIWSDVNIVLMAVVVVLSLISSRGSSRVLGSVLLFFGVALLLASHASFQVWREALQVNAPLIAMFIMVPLMGVPIRCGEYNDSLRKIFERHARSDTKYYGLVGGAAALLGTLVSIASLPLTYEIARTSWRSRNAKLIGTALSRGFATCMIWAPTSATIALVVQLTGVDWFDMFPWALTIALVVFAVGLCLAHFGKKNDGGIDRGSWSPGTSIDSVKVRELCALSFLLIAAIVAIAKLLGVSVILAVAMASLFFPAAWMAAIGRWPLYVDEFKHTYVKKKLPRAKNQILLFTGAGFFAEGIESSHLGDAIGSALLAATGSCVPLLTVAIMVVALLAAAAGIHPVAIIAVLGGALSAADCGVSSVYMALVLSVSWALSNVLCPASANNIAVADMVETSAVELGLRWNLPYAVVSVVVVTFVLSAMRAIGVV